MTTALPRSFQEIEGWRESFRAAAKRLDDVRTGSLFPSLPTRLCGEPVRAFTMRDWTVLDQADSPFVAGGRVTVAHCVSLLWILAPNYRINGRLARFMRARLTWRVMKRNGYDEDAIVRECMDFVDDAFIDWPGRFTPRKAGGGGGISATRWPRKCAEIEYCSDVMRVYPSFRYEELVGMPLAQFWQWLHEARSTLNPEYRNYQLTDEVNAQASAELNRLRREQLEAAQQTNP